MKNALVAVLAIVVLGGVGFYFWQSDMQSPRNVQSEPTQQTNTQPQSAVSAKINIDAVCQGALAYMTFPDGAASEKFVAECKEGKHPEVIEKFKADMNLGAGAAI